MRKSIEERFWTKVDKSGNCWEWTGSKCPGGYGHMNVSNKYIRSNRLSWQLHFGEIPAGMCVLHHCDNPSCVNPAHLFLGTQLDNIKDRHSKGRSSSQKGELHGRAKLTNNDIPIIKQLAAHGFMQKTIARHFNVSYSVIGLIVRNKIWKHIEVKP